MWWATSWQPQSLPVGPHFTSSYSHPQLLDALAKAAAQALPKHSVECQLAVQVVPRFGMQPADVAQQASAEGWVVPGHVLGELAVDVQQQRKQRQRVQCPQGEQHCYVHHEVLVRRAGHKGVLDGDAVRAHAARHTALVHHAAAALGRLSGASEVRVAANAFTCMVTKRKLNAGMTPSDREKGSLSVYCQRARLPASRYQRACLPASQAALPRCSQRCSNAALATCTCGVSSVGHYAWLVAHVVVHTLRLQGHVAK